MAFSVVAALLLSAIPALSSPLVEERTEGKCNRDNVLRALVDQRHIAEALPFCSTYIHVPATTITATTSCATTTVTLVIDPLPVFTTVIPTVTVTETSSQSTVYSAYTPPAYYGKEKRTDAAYAPVPTFVSQYPPSRISSACSCLTINPSSTTVPCSEVTVVETISPDAPTITIYSTPPATVTTTIPAQAATTLPAICNPQLFKEYKSGVDRNGVGKLVQIFEPTELACCLACFKAKDCTLFQFRPDNPTESRCEYSQRVEASDPSERKDICPLGVTKLSGLGAPQGVGNGYWYNYGPCFEDSPLGG